MYPRVSHDAAGRLSCSALQSRNALQESVPARLKLAHRDREKCGVDGSQLAKRRASHNRSDEGCVIASAADWNNNYNHSLHSSPIASDTKSCTQVQASNAEQHMGTAQVLPQSPTPYALAVTLSLDTVTLDDVACNMTEGRRDAASVAGFTSAQDLLLEAFSCAAQEQVIKHVAQHRAVLRDFFGRHIRSGPQVCPSAF
jgi:hypothetical protein